MWFSSTCAIHANWTASARCQAHSHALAECWNSGSTRKARITNQSSPRTSVLSSSAPAAGVQRSRRRRRRKWASKTWPMSKAASAPGKTQAARLNRLSRERNARARNDRDVTHVTVTNVTATSEGRSRPGGHLPQQLARQPDAAHPPAQIAQLQLQVDRLGGATGPHRHLKPHRAVEESRHHPRLVLLIGAGHKRHRRHRLRRHPLIHETAGYAAHEFM